ncbi:MAG: transketolase [Patescibacteria group bacterium]|nr:transketolase [Patescibacteria group bacterium]
MDIEKLQKLARLIRYYILLATTTAGSGHTTSSLSAVEMMTALMFGGIFRADLDSPENESNDRLIFSKGHASPLFYSLYAAAGEVTHDELLKYRKFDSPLEGHPTLEFRYTEAPTGSLGQGLSIGLGEALALKKLIFSDESIGIPRVFVLLGDGEIAEGSVWEAAAAASYHKIDNLVAIVDVNRQGQSQATMYEHHLEVYKQRFEAFGWYTLTVDGHDFTEIEKVYKEAISQTGKGKPVIILAKTFKGRGVKALEDKDGWHGKPLPLDMFEVAVRELGEVDFRIKGEVSKPVANVKKNQPSVAGHQLPTYKSDESVATRKATGNALTALMYGNPKIVVLDGDVKNSLYTENTMKEHPDRYFEMFIAEQNMVDMAIGLSRRGFIPFMTTFSAFMTRAYDQIRMAALAAANIKFIGSHAGVSIGADGASQMGLEDMSLFRTLLGSVVLQPADAVSATKLMQEMIEKPGIAYIRVARPGTAIVYGNDEKFEIGGSKVHYLKNKEPFAPAQEGAQGKQKTNNKVIIAATGITLYEALKAQEELAKEGIEAVVVDCYSVKPIDQKTLVSLAQSITNIITVEDHWFEGGLGDAVLNVFTQTPFVKVYKLAVTKLPHSGKPAELLDFEGISAQEITKKVREVLSA